MLHSQATQLTFGEETPIELDTQDGVFTPNATTAVFLSAIEEYLSQPCKVLDLGSGTGVVGITLAQKGLVAGSLRASDIGETAVQCIRKNCEKYNIEVDARVGSLFEPWQGEKFDCIADLVSVIAEGAAKISPWYNGISCAAGVDGADLVVEILETAPQHLTDQGKIFFPIISLANVDRVLAAAKANFTHVEFLKREQWPLPQSMYDHMDTLLALKEQGHILLEKKFGTIICYTEIYVAYNQK